MIDRRIFLAGLVALGTGPALAEDVRLISPTEAHTKRQSGQVKLVDVRERFEWEEGGVAEGADLIASVTQSSPRNSRRSRVETKTPRSL